MAVHSIAFIDDGRALVLAHPRNLTKLSWPERDMLAVQERATLNVVATRDGTLLCVGVDHVAELDAHLVEQRRAAIAPVDASGGRLRAAAVDDHGAFVVCRALGDGGRRYVIERYDPPLPPVEVARFQLNASWPWWAALLPSKKRVVFAMNDSAPEHVDWATGEHDAAWRWPPRWEHRALHFAGGGRRSWLSVDAAVDERCLVVSDKGQESTVIWLDDVGRISHASPSATTRDVVKSYVALEKVQRAPSAEEAAAGRFFTKGPARGAAATVHPRDDVALVIDISGRLFVNDARTGAMLEPPEQLAGGGYRWEG